MTQEQKDKMILVFINMNMYGENYIKQNYPNQAEFVIQNKHLTVKGFTKLLDKTKWIYGG